MTTIYEDKTRCALCGEETDFTALGSTNAFGSPDLDTRPPEMRRSTIFAWVQRCPGCGYCAAKIDKSHPGARAVVKGVGYGQQLDNPLYPKLANSFLCKSMIDQETGDYAGASWGLIHAAWVCDDARRPDEAKACRQKAAEMLVTAEAHGQQVASQNGASTAILVDLLRRSGRTDEARKVIEQCRSLLSEDIINQILDFQTVLLEKGDSARHTISEALKESA